MPCFFFPPCLSSLRAVFFIALPLWHLVFFSALCICYVYWRSVSRCLSFSAHFVTWCFFVASHFCGVSFLGILDFLVLPSIWGLLYGLCVVSSARGLFALVTLLCPWALSALVFFAYFAHASAWSLLSSTCLYPFVIFVHSHASTLTHPFSYVHSHASIFMSPFFVAPLASALSTCAHLAYAFFFFIIRFPLRCAFLPLVVGEFWVCSTEQGPCLDPKACGPVGSPFSHPILNR